LIFAAGGTVVRTIIVFAFFKTIHAYLYVTNKAVFFRFQRNVLAANKTIFTIFHISIISHLPQKPLTCLQVMPIKSVMSPKPRKPVDVSTYEGRFAVRLRTLREKAKLTHEEAAAQIGVSATAIYHWEAGLKIPAVPKFPQIAEAYNLNRAKDILPLM